MAAASKTKKKVAKPRKVAVKQQTVPAPTPEESTVEVAEPTPPEAPPEAKDSDGGTDAGPKTEAPDTEPWPADPPPYDLTDAVRRFKERRLRMSVYDMLVLGTALGVAQVNTLTYDRLRKRIRLAIRDGRNS